MNINRHNYEEFFLLYADNELCTADRKAVEVFVAENPDLKKELQLLLQTVIGADAVVFDNKELLLKPAVTPLQEQLLLLLDNELETAEAKKIQQQLASDTAAATEFDLLKQTKLQADTHIVFAHKKELYRKEEGRVIGMGWRRAAAAAVLLGFGTWAVFTMVKPAQQTGGNVTAGNNSTVQPAKQPGATNSNVLPQQPVQVINPTATNNNTVYTPTITAPEKAVAPVVNSTEKKRLQQRENDNDNIAVQNKKPSNNLPEPLYNNFNNEERNKTIAQAVIPTEESNNKVNSGAADLIASLPKPKQQTINGYAVTAAYNPDEKEETNDDKVLYMDEENVKRSRLGGFIRKVKRVVERSANIKTGNGIKVAGFDIALNK